MTQLQTRQAILHAETQRFEVLQHNNMLATGATIITIGQVALWEYWLPAVATEQRHHVLIYINLIRERLLAAIQLTTRETRNLPLDDD